MRDAMESSLVHSSRITIYTDKLGKYIFYGFSRIYFWGKIPLVNKQMNNCEANGIPLGIRQSNLIIQ